MPDPSAPVGPDGLPNRWIVTTDTVSELGAYIVELHNQIESLSICLGEQSK